MCGIVGACFTKEKEQLLALHNMLPQLHHRGPDDEGIWFDFDAGIGLAHRRLSIVDLSKSGHQPMTSVSGRYVTVFNGEIYNHESIRKQLIVENQVYFRGHSDTEVLLAAIENWGLEKALSKTVGMFAIALWDKKERALYLMRDRFGEKPLYYSWINSALVFSSELRTFQHFPGFQKKISHNALDLYLQYSYIPQPFSIYSGVHKIPPGKYLKITENNVEEKTYWSAKVMAEYGLRNQSPLSYLDATDELEERLRQTIKLQMSADVPVGSFLSGGIDSSLISALMQAHSAVPIKTFSIGFNDAKYNEATYAKTIAKHLKTDHTELYVTDSMCQDLLPTFPLLFDEPHADQSQLAMHFLAKLAREKVTVTLSGDAGDELFGGYQRYFYSQTLWNVIHRIPLKMRKVLGKSICAVFQKTSISNQQKNSVRKILKYAELFSTVKERNELYLAFIRSNSTPWLADVKGEASTLFTEQNEWLSSSHFLEWMMWLDSVTYLPDDVLTKVDRTTMSVSLENRVPFLDHRVFEFAWQLPLEYKVQKNEGKRILRDILYRHVPKKLVDRPKQGFGMPLSQWMRGSLSPWFEEILCQPQLLADYWNVNYLKKQWQVVKKTHNTQHDALFWSIFVFQQWLESTKI